MEQDSEARDPWFTIVEMEVNARCNRRCSYCPVSVLPVLKQEKLMSSAVFERILAELQRIGFKGKMSYHLFNEPLLRRDLEVLVAKVAQLLPEVYQLLFTNGDLLNDKRYASLKGAGIDHFIVTRHGWEDIATRPDQTVQFPSDLVIANRGGFFEPLAEPLTLPCYAPSDMLILNAEGDVLLCCDDANHTHVVGNIMRQDLEDIWFSPAFVAVRHTLQAGKRSEAPSICRSCDNREYFASGENDNKHLRKPLPR
jgi:cyclic pyranopterin phosphate synthase